MTLEEAAEKVLAVIIDHQKSWQSGNQGQDALLDACVELKEVLRAYGDQRFIEGATAMREMAAKECDQMGDYVQERFGLDRGAQDYFRARNAIRKLDPNQLKDTDHG